MASKFFQRPSLGQANLTDSQKTTLRGSDQKAVDKARLAAEGINRLNSGIIGTAQTLSAKYIDNIQAKNRLESSKQTPFFISHVENEIANTENFETLGAQGLQDKYREYSESFLENYKDSPFRDQLQQDLESMSQSMLANMLKKRDAIHTRKVTDSTADGAAAIADMFSQGLIDGDQVKGRLSELMFDSTVAFQTPSSSELELDEDTRGKYQGLTKQQAKEAILRGIMVKAGEPNNSSIARLLDSDEFRKSMGYSKSDPEYNQLVAQAYKQGAKADKVNYENNLDTLKNTLYDKVNTGVVIDVDSSIESFKAEGNELTPEDEFKVRRIFKVENDTTVNANNYRMGLLDGKDTSTGLTRKERETVYEKAFSDVLGFSKDDMTIENVNAALSTRSGQVEFGDYIKSGGKLPDKFKKMFNVPAGASEEKWDQAAATLATLQAASTGSGQSIEQLIGVNEVAKVRGMARILNDPNMEGAVKQNAIESLQTNSANFNSKGYLRGSEDKQVDKEWLNDVSKDAPWTTDDYVSDLQNADEIEGNYNAYRLAGMSDEDAKEAAVDLFNKSNRAMEMSNGDEIAVPVAHKYLNNITINEFAKSMTTDARGNTVPRFPSIMQQIEELEMTTGEGYISEWRARTNISFQKAHDFGKTKNYNMLYNGRLVENATFNYSEIEDFIAKSPSKLKEKMTGIEHRSFDEVEKEALEKRQENIDARSSQESLLRQMDDVFNLKI